MPSASSWRAAVSRPHVLIIDGDDETAVSLEEALAEAGVVASFANDAVSAIEKIREQRYCAVILDPMIRRGLNGYAVLDFLESEQPENLARLFLLTGMSEQTIRRTAPALLARLYRKPSGVPGLVAAVIAAVPPETVSSERKCVLLIEDDGPTAAATMALLHELSFAVEWAHDGQAAVDAVRRRDFDIILLDLVLPGMDGFGVLDHLHAEHAKLLSRVVITTGMPEKYLQLVPDHEVCGILRKPLDVTELQRLLVAA
jgi:CheY-like chemotaxis protein